MTVNVEVSVHVTYGDGPPYSANVAVSIKNQSTGTVYGPATTATVATPALFSAGDVIAQFSGVPDGVYKIHLHDAGGYGFPDQWASEDSYEFGYQSEADTPFTFTVAGTAAPHVGYVTDLIVPTGFIGACHAYVVNNETAFTELGPGQYRVEAMTSSSVVLSAGIEHVYAIDPSNDEPGAFMLPVKTDGTPFRIRVTRLIDGAISWIAGYTGSGSGDYATAMAGSYAAATEYAWNLSSTSGDDKADIVGHPTWRNYKDLATDLTGWPLLGTMSAPVALGAPVLAFLPGMEGAYTAGVQFAGSIVQPPFTSWTADTSRKFSIPVALGAVLEFEDTPAAGTNVHLLTRHSLVMPTPVLDANGIPDDTFVPADTTSVWGRLQLTIEHRDMTFFRGVPVQVKSWGSAEPGGDTAMVLEFPQVTAFELLGAGDRDLFVDGKRVFLNVMRANGTRVRLFTGEIVSPETIATESTDALVIHVQGILFTADNSTLAPSFHSEERDIGVVIAETLDGYGSRKYAACPAITTGILTRSRGAWTPRLSGYIQDLLGTATTADGSSQWTVHNHGLLPRILLKDRTTVHATVTTGTPGVSLDLTSDRTGAPNVIYGEGVAPDGGRWRNTKYPNLRADDAPLYPLGMSVFNPGSVTTGFAAFADEMRQSGYTMASGDTYSSADESEVRDIQAGNGITVDGVVGPQTWAAVFAVGSNGGDLTGAYFAPLAYDPRVMFNKHNAQGAVTGINPNYDPQILRVERYENFGSGITKHQGVQSARAELARVGSPGVQGTVTLKIDPEETSRFELRAGMNLMLKAYRGADRLLHIAGVQVDWEAQTVTLTVDNHARDLLTLAAIRSRNADAATDPVRRNLPQRRTSRNTQDNTVIFDAESGAGIVPRHALFHGLWNVLRIPAGQLGSVARSRFTTDSPAAPFAVAVFSKPVTANDMVRLVGNPLIQGLPFNPSADALYDAGLMMAWGSQDEPAGYYPGTKTGGGSVTGRLVDDATWFYESTKPPWLWVALYSSSTCFIAGQLNAAPDGY